MVVDITSSFVGQVTRLNSPQESLTNVVNFPISSPKKVAGQEGLEPPTIGFGVRRSTN